MLSYNVHVCLVLGGVSLQDLVGGASVAQQVLVDQHLVTVVSVHRQKLHPGDVQNGLIRSGKK